MPLAQQGISALLGHINLTHVLLVHLAQAKGCKAVPDALIVMEESIVVMKDWLLQMVPVIQDISVRSVQ